MQVAGAARGRWESSPPLRIAGLRGQGVRTVRKFEVVTSLAWSEFL